MSTPEQEQNAEREPTADERAAILARVAQIAECDAVVPVMRFRLARSSRPCRLRRPRL